MARHTGQQDDESSDSINVNRRDVLKGFGAAGVGTAVPVGLASQSGSTQAASSEDPPETEGDIPTSTQFYSYRSTDLSVPELIRETADAGYDAFETYSVGADTDVEPILAAADDAGISMSSAHVSLDAVENDTEAMVETFSQFGDPTLIDPGVAADDWGDEDAVVELAERFNAAAEMLADESELSLGHHNHETEFAEIGDTTGYDIFAENLDDRVTIQLDVGWVLVGGRDPIDFITEHSTNVRSLHMKNMDVSETAFTNVDEGDVNMRAVATAFRNTGNTDYLVHEHDDPEEPLYAMENGAYWLEKVNQPWMPHGVCAVPNAQPHPGKLYSPESA